MFGWESFGRVFIMIGIFLIILGILLLVGGKFGIGKLPGDIYYKKGNFTFYFPIVTCILLSIILSLVLTFIRRF